MQISSATQSPGKSSVRKNSAGKTGAMILKLTPLYCGHGRAECGSTVSSGKLNAPVDCAGGRSHLKPLQQWNVLGMVDKVEPFFLYLNGRRCVRQHLNGVALFQVVLESNSANRTAR